MKIGLFTDSSVFAGTERHIFDLARELRGAGCEASVLAPGKGLLAARCREACIPVSPIEKRDLVDLVTVGRLALCLKKKEFDLIHAHNGRTALLASLAATTAGRGKIIATNHFISPARTRRRGFKAALSRSAHRWLARKLTYTIAISEAVRSASVERGEIAPGKIRVIPNGIADPLALLLQSPAEIRQALGLTGGQPLIVSAARLEPEKGIPSLISAIAIVQLKFPNVRCVVAGEGAMRSQLQEKIDAAGLGSAFQLLGFQRDIFSLMNAADIFVLPSPNEPFGLVLLEAMALARPVVAIAAGGPVEIIKDGDCGFLASPENPPSLAKGLIQLLKNRDLSTACGHAARRRFQERFTASRMAAATLDLYAQLLQSSL